MLILWITLLHRLIKKIFFFNLNFILKKFNVKHCHYLFERNVRIRFHVMHFVLLFFFLFKKTRIFYSQKKINTSEM